MAKINQLTRFCRIINRLSGLQEYVSTEDLLACVTGIMGDDKECTVRTLQRDIRSIEEIFGLEIEFVRGLGYHICGRPTDNSRFSGLLADFQIIAAMDNTPGLHEYILPEHRTPVINVEINTLLNAIKDRRVVRFTYYRPIQNEERQYDAEPYFIKQSQGKWYLLALVNGEVRSFELGRFRSFRVLSSTFERKEDIISNDMFSNAFGIWDDENKPIEHIVFSVSQMEWRFMQTYPIHHTQTLVSANNDRVTVSIDVKVTHDLMMDLLSRAYSLRILEPGYLREEYKQILATALENNK